MFEIMTCPLAGVVALRPTIRRDSRGSFVKTVHRAFFAEHGIPSEFAEQYYSYSIRNVLRGLHFQAPPNDHYKLVTCIEGDVLDVVMDLRRGSVTYGRHHVFELNDQRADSVFIPSGLAHGFYVRSASALVLYNVSTVHAPAYDTGIRWDSAGILWPTTAPHVSDRDAALPPFSVVDTPF